MPSFAFNEPPFFPVDLPFAFVFRDDIPVVHYGGDLSHSKYEYDTQCRAVVLFGGNKDDI
jgi:hypothetical protein